MRNSSIGWPLPLLFIVAVLTSALALATHGRSEEIVLDSFTGALAVLGVLMVAGRMALGFAHRQERLLWQFVLSVFVLVALGELVEPYGERIRRGIGFNNIDDGLLLAIAPIGLWLTSRLDVTPTKVRAAVIVAFLLQIASTILGLAPGQPLFGLPPAQVENIADLIQFVATQCYLAATLLIFLELKWRRTTLAAVPGVAIRLWPPPLHLFSPRRYRNQPVSILRAGYRQAALQSMPWWKLPLIALAGLLWPLAVLVSSLAVELPRHGGRIRAATGRSLAGQFRDHVVIGMTANLWPHQYYKFELHRPELRPRAYEYLQRVETKRALYKLLRTDHREEDRFRDKLRFFRACTRVQVRTVPVFLAICDGRILHPEPKVTPILPACDLFLKPRVGRGGVGAEIVEFRDGGYSEAHGPVVPADELISRLLARPDTPDLIVQPRLVNHPKLAGINMQALSTVRVVTATDKNGQARVIAAALRVPIKAGSVIDNFHAGGIAAAVDLETGRLGQATDLGLGSGSRWHSVHPVTGGQIEGLEVPDWRRLMDLARLAHAQLADRIVLGWDIAALPDGPCIIEANAYPDLDINQRTMLAPLGNDRLGRLMAYHLDRLAAERADRSGSGR